MFKKMKYLIFICSIITISIVVGDSNDGEIKPSYKTLPGMEKNSIIIHLLDWPYDMIASECEGFLKEKKITAVQVS